MTVDICSIAGGDGMEVLHNLTHFMYMYDPNWQATE